jgi:hypothetical protein
VSKLHPSPHPDKIQKELAFRDLWIRDFEDRLAFARDNGCNTVMLTGNGEPLMNKDFLNDFAMYNHQLSDPFRWIEIQTSGITLDDIEILRWLRNTIRVSIISLSLSSIFSSAKNAEYNQTSDKLVVDIDKVCGLIKKYSFGLRLSLNMTDDYDYHSAEEIFIRAKELGADQITFRMLYTSQSEGAEHQEINEWINTHSVNPYWAFDLNNYIKAHGRPLEKLPFGGIRYSVDGMSVVVDDDCMSTDPNQQTVKYLILQPNCKLYTKWDDLGSYLF